MFVSFCCNIILFTLQSVNPPIFENTFSDKLYLREHCDLNTKCARDEDNRDVTKCSPCWPTTGNEDVEEENGCLLE